MSGPQGKQAAWAIKLDPLRCSRSCLSFGSDQFLPELFPTTRLHPNCQVLLGPLTSGNSWDLESFSKSGSHCDWKSWFDACGPLLVISMILSDAYFTESVPYWAVATIRLSKCHLPELTTQSFLFGHLSISLGFPLHWKLQHYLRFLLRLCTLVLSQRRGAF